MKKWKKYAAYFLAFGLSVSAAAGSARDVRAAEKAGKANAAAIDRTGAENPDFTSYTDITEDIPAVAEITDDAPYSVFRFIPETTAEYTFFSDSDTDTRGYIYQEDGTLLASDDDGGYSENFAAKAELTAGETYYCLAEIYYSGETGSFLCVISSTTDRYIPSQEDIEEITVSVDSISLYENEAFTDFIPLSWLKLNFRLSCGITISKVSGSNGRIWNTSIEGRFKYTLEDDPDAADTTKTDNAIIYSFMGIDCTEIPVTFMESPVRSIVCSDNPWPKLVQSLAENTIYDSYNELTLTLFYPDGSSKNCVWDEGLIYIDDEWIRPATRWKLYDYDMDMPETGANAFIIYLLGQSVEIPIEIIDNPISSLSVLQNPSKTVYLPFEDIDLYGLRLLVSYTDGTEEDVTVSTHCSSFQLNDSYRSFIHSDFFWGDDEIEGISIFCLFTYTSFPVKMQDYASVFGNAVPLSSGQTVSVALNPAQTYRIYRFTPGETADYTIKSEGNCDTFVTLVDQNGKPLESNDDADEDTDSNFHLQYRLEAGKVYYYFVRLYRSLQEGTFTCSLSGGSAAPPTPVIYTITYQLNGGANHAANPAVFTTEAVNLQNPSRAGYTFGGWYTDAALTAKITQIPAGAGANYTIYAKWTKVTAPGKAKLSSVKNAKSKKINVKYKKVKKAEGYEIAYSTNKKFKKSASKTVTSKKTNATINGLKKGKTYFIRVCAYNVDSTGRKIRGKWSSVKQIKIKK